METYNSEFDPDPPDASENAETHTQPRCRNLKLDVPDLHNRIMHSEVEPTAPHCYRCKLVMRSWKIVREHIKNSFLLPDGRHSCVALNNPPYTCPKTGSVFKSILQYKLHLSKFNKRKLKCVFCSKEFGLKRGLAKHIRKRHPSKHTADQTDPTSAPDTKKTDGFGDIQRCEECLKMTTHIELHKIIYHQKNKQKGDKRYHCPYCNRSYTRASVALNHALRSGLLESGQRACTISLSLLNVQAKHHCRVCGEWFGHKNALRRHLLKLHKAKIPGQTKTQISPTTIKLKVETQRKLRKQALHQEKTSTDSHSSEIVNESSSKKLPGKSANPTKIDWSMIQSWIKGCDKAECSEPTELAKELKTAIRAVHLSKGLLENAMSSIYTSENRYCNHCQRNVDDYDIHRLIAHQGRNDGSFCPLCKTRFSRHHVAFRHLESSAINGKGTYHCARSNVTRGLSLNKEAIAVLASAYEYFCKRYIKRERVCQKCGRAYYSRDGLIKHLKVVHKSQAFTPVYNTDGETRSSLLLTSKSSSKHDEFVCPSDDKVQSDASKEYENIESTRNDDVESDAFNENKEEFQCPSYENVESDLFNECAEFQCPSDDNVKAHSTADRDQLGSLEDKAESNCQEARTYSWCQHCKREVRGVERHNLIMHSMDGQTTPKCFRCNKIMKSEEITEEHLNDSFLLPDGRYSCVAIKEPPYACPETGKIFKHRYLFQLHLSKFRKDRLFCRVCNKAYSKRRSLDYHIMKHHPMQRSDARAGAKNNFRFKQPKEISYDVPKTAKRCNQCMKVTPHLELHKQIYHQKNKKEGDKRYYCPHCNKSFLRACDAFNHALRSGLFPDGKRACTVSVKLLKSGKKFNCKICNERFTTKPSLRRHILRLHKDVIPAQYQSEVPVKKRKQKPIKKSTKSSIEGNNNNASVPSETLENITAKLDMSVEMSWIKESTDHEKTKLSNLDRKPKCKKPFRHLNRRLKVVHQSAKETESEPDVTPEHPESEQTTLPQTGPELIPEEPAPEESAPEKPVPEEPATEEPIPELEHKPEHETRSEGCSCTVCSTEEPQYIMIPVFPKQPRKRRMKNNQCDSDPDYNFTKKKVKKKQK